MGIGENVGENVGENTGQNSYSSSGALVQGQSLVLTGSGFGTKSTPGPLIFEDFSTGSDTNEIGGEAPTIDNIGSFTWGTFTNEGVGNEPTYSDTQTRPHASLSSYHQFGGSLGYASSIQISEDFGTQTGDELYMTFWSYYIRTSELWSINYKPWIVEGPGTSNTPMIYVGMGDPGVGDGSIRSGTFWDGGVDWMYASTSPSDINERWVRFELYAKQSASGSSNGAVEYYTHLPDEGIEGRSDFSYQTRNSSNYWDLVQFGYYNSRVTNSASADIYLSDIYVDDTRKRVEFGDSSTWGSCTKREVQPATSWADTSITITVNKGIFTAGDTVYVHVVDSDGTADYLGSYQV